MEDREVGQRVWACGVLVFWGEGCDFFGFERFGDREMFDLY